MYIWLLSDKVKPHIYVVVSCHVFFYFSFIQPVHIHTVQPTCYVTTILYDSLNSLSLHSLCAFSQTPLVFFTPLYLSCLFVLSLLHLSLFSLTHDPFSRDWRPPSLFSQSCKDLHRHTSPFFRLLLVFLKTLSVLFHTPSQTNQFS